MRAPVTACLITREDRGLVDAVRSVIDHVSQLVVVNTSPRFDADMANCLQSSSIPVVIDWFTLCNESPVDGKIADFSLARNHTYSFATHPWVMWLDADDVARGAKHLAAVIRRADRLREGHPCRVVFPYEYAYDGDGDCCLLQGRERLSTRGDFEWRRAVHEGLVPREDRVLQPRDVLDESIVWKHHRQHLVGSGPDDPKRNERILRRMLAEDPDDLRTRLDLGTELSIQARVATNEEVRHVLDAEAREHLRAAGDDYGAHMALCQVELREALAACNRGQHFDPREAEAHALAAIRIRPWDQPYFELAKVAYIHSTSAGLTPRQEKILLEKAVVYATAGLSAKQVPLPDQHDPLERSLRVHELLADCRDRLGDTDKALEHVAMAREAKPRLRRLVDREFEYEARVVRSRVAADLKKLRSLNAIGESSYECAREAVEEPHLLRLRIAKAAAFKFESDKRVGRTRVSIACGTTLQAWSPESIRRTGSGGSEVAVVEVAKRLVREGGCDVTVFVGDGPTHVVDGVTYRRSGELWLSEPCDVLVAWRNAALLEPEAGPLSVGMRVLWVHDCDPQNMNLQRALLADRVFALSNWHREHLLKAWKFAPAQVVVTRNGIDPTRFEGRSIERNPRKAVYSSSPERGLMNLLAVWPLVRRKVSDAELHVFYGFDGMRSAASHLRDPEMLRQASVIESYLEKMRPQGVYARGKVDPQALADEMLSAGAWLYPTWFEETSCITAMEAQAAGLAIVTTPLAALNETAAHALPGGMAWFATEGDGVAADPTTRSYQDCFAEYAVEALTRKWTEADRAVTSDRAKRDFSWDGIGAEWVEVFEQVLSAGFELPAYVPEAAE